MTERAFQLLQWIEESQNIDKSAPLGPAPARTQMELFPRGRHPVLDTLRSLDPDTLTPLEALNLLGQLKRQCEDGR